MKKKIYLLVVLMLNMTLSYNHIKDTVSLSSTTAYGQQTEFDAEDKATADAALEVSKACGCLVIIEDGLGPGKDDRYFKGKNGATVGIGWSIDGGNSSSSTGYVTINPHTGKKEWHNKSSGSSGKSAPGTIRIYNDYIDPIDQDYAQYSQQQASNNNGSNSTGTGSGGGPGPGADYYNRDKSKGSNYSETYKNNSIGRYEVYQSGSEFEPLPSQDNRLSKTPDVIDANVRAKLKIESACSNSRGASCTEKLILNDKKFDMDGVIDKAFIEAFIEEYPYLESLKAKILFSAGFLNTLEVTVKDLFNVLRNLDNLDAMEAALDELLVLGVHCSNNPGCDEKALDLASKLLDATQAEILKAVNGDHYAAGEISAEILLSFVPVSKITKLLKATKYGAKAVKVADGIVDNVKRVVSKGDDVVERFLKRSDWKDDLIKKYGDDIGDFKPRGLNPSQVSQSTKNAMLKEYPSSLSPQLKERFLSDVLKSGSTSPVRLKMNSGGELFKVVPKGNTPNKSPFYLRKSELDNLKKSGNIEQKLGLPISSHAAEYDVYKAVAKQTVNVFKSKVAPTIQNGYKTTGGATQSLILDTSKWSISKVETIVP